MALVVTALTFFVGVGALFFSVGHQYAPRAGVHELLVPPENMTHFSFGYQELVADTLWLRVIQDFDTCGKTQMTGVAPIPLAEEAINQDREQRVGRCENSWVYRMIDAITELAPQFRVPYSSGGVILSVAVDDISGAAKIYDKAAIRFPTDWQIAYKAAYHSLYEMGDRKKAAQQLVTAGENGAPRWVPILAARLYSKSGSAELGKAVLNDLLSKNPDLADNLHIKQRMAEIERDLAAGDDVPAPAPAQRPTTLPKKNL